MTIFEEYQSRLKERKPLIRVDMANGLCFAFRRTDDLAEVTKIAEEAVRLARDTKNDNGLFKVREICAGGNFGWASQAYHMEARHVGMFRPLMDAAGKPVMEGGEPVLDDDLKPVMRDGVPVLQGQTQAWEMVPEKWRYDQFLELTRVDAQGFRSIWEALIEMMGVSYTTEEVDYIREKKAISSATCLNGSSFSPASEPGECTPISCEASPKAAQ